MNLTHDQISSQTWMPFEVFVPVAGPRGRNCIPSSTGYSSSNGFGHHPGPANNVFYAFYNVLRHLELGLNVEDGERAHTASNRRSVIPQLIASSISHRHSRIATCKSSYILYCSETFDRRSSHAFGRSSSFLAGGWSGRDRY